MRSIALLALVTAPVLYGQAKPAVKEVPITQTPAADGPAMYKEYCAVCHGPQGKGDGPAAAALKTVPGNLTMLAARNNGKYPEARVAAMIEGKTGVPAHGSREMPMWGTLFKSLGSGGDNAGLAAIRVRALVKYVETLQAR